MKFPTHFSTRFKISYAYRMYNISKLSIDCIAEISVKYTITYLLLRFESSHPDHQNPWKFSVSEGF